jgi:CheY-like chemotaxis protein
VSQSETVGKLDNRSRELEEVNEQGDAEHARRVLVVDDNRDSATSLCMMLELMGTEARTAFDGLSALEVAEVFRPDIILLDIGMPGMNGYDTARRIREKSWGESTKLFALTGWSQESDRKRSEEAGFDGHIIKPIEPSELQKLLMH